MKKSTTLLLVGGGVLALYLYEKSKGGQGFMVGQGSLPGGYYSASGNPANYVPVNAGGNLGGGAPRPRFRR